jgi:hypothetical protein
MLFCQAYPIKKMVPLDRLASADPCLGRDFAQCPLFQDLVARLHAAAEAPARPLARCRRVAQKNKEAES